MTESSSDVDAPQMSPDEVHYLLDTAFGSIRHGLDTGEPLNPMDQRDIPASLTRPAASFVTLNIEGTLRGCIGSLEARRPLLEDVAHNAFAAAFRDPRFPPLSQDEYGSLELHISLLTPSTPLDVADEEELLRALRPGVDGLILEDPPYRSVFLPQVWESLPEPAKFVAQLKLKAGLPADHWSDGLRFSRFTVEEISGDDLSEGSKFT